MRYLKFRNILILLEVQEIDRLPEKQEPPPQRLRNWQTLSTAVRRESHTSRYQRWYVSMHQSAKENEKTNREKETNHKTKQTPSPPTRPPLTQLKGSWNSSAVKKAQEKG